MKVLPANIIKKLPDGFSDTVDSMSDEELNAKVLEAEGNIYNSDDALATNDAILDAKRALKDMTQPFRDAKSREKAKIMYCLFLMEQRGREIGGEE